MGKWVWQCIIRLYLLDIAIRYVFIRYVFVLLIGRTVSHMAYSMANHLARSWSRCTGKLGQVAISHPLGSWLPLLSARPAVTFPAAEHHCSLLSTKSYCLVTEAHRSEQLAQGCYADFAWVRFEPTNCWSQVQRSTRCATGPPRARLDQQKLQVILLSRELLVTEVIMCPSQSLAELCLWVLFDACLLLWRECLAFCCECVNVIVHCNCHCHTGGLDSRNGGLTCGSTKVLRRGSNISVWIIASRSMTFGRSLQRRTSRVLLNWMLSRTVIQSR